MTRREPFIQTLRNGFQGAVLSQKSFLRDMIPNRMQGMHFPPIQQEDIDDELTRLTFMYDDGEEVVNVTWGESKFTQGSFRIKGIE